MSTNSNYELHVETNVFLVKVLYQKENSILEKEVITQAYGEIDSLMKKNPGQAYDLILDLTGVKLTKVSSDVTAHIDGMVDESSMRKIAIVGLGRLISTFVNFSAAYLGRSSTVKFFTTVDKAMEWIKS